MELEGVTTLTQLPDPWEYPQPSDQFTIRNQLLQYFPHRAEFINFKLSRRLEAKTWVCNAQSHKISLMTTRLNVVKEQFRAIQTLFEHVLHAYRSLSRSFRGLVPPIDDQPAKLPTVRKLVNHKDISRQQTRRASIMAFRFQAFQNKTSNVKESFTGERPTSQNPSIAEEGQRETFSSKAIDKLLSAIKSGDDDEAEVIQKRCEEIETCISDIENRIYSSHKAEMARWSQFLCHLRDNYDSELAKRQEDVRQLNGALSTWVKRFLDLQEMLLPQDYEKCSPKVEDILRILDRTQQLAADSLREKSRLSASWLIPREVIERHEGDYGDEIIKDFDESGEHEDSDS